MAVEGVRDRPAATSFGLHYPSLVHTTGAFRLGLESESATDNIRTHAWSDVKLGDVKQHWDDRPLDLNVLHDRTVGRGASLLPTASGTERWSSGWATADSDGLEAADAAGTRGGSLDPALRLASASLSEEVRSTWAPPSAATASASELAAAAPRSFLLGHPGAGYGGLPMSFEPGLGHGLHQGLPGQQYALPLRFAGQGDFQGATFSHAPQPQGLYGGEAPGQAIPQHRVPLQPAMQPLNFQTSSYPPVGMGNPLTPMSYGMGQELYQAALAQHMENLDLNPMPDEYASPAMPGNGGRSGRRKGKSGQGDRAGNGQAAQQQPRNNVQQWGGRGGRGGGGGRGGARGGGRNRGARGRGGGGGSHKNDAATVRRTIYITDIDSQVTEEQLAIHFNECGTLVDCRVCGDPNSAMRFAFIEFTEEQAVTKALGMTGSLLGPRPLRVVRSRTAIVPVNNDLLPRDHVERESCVRTVYATNIDKKVERSDVLAFFEGLCGKVSKLRLLGDYQHPSRIAFVEFEQAESAMAALNCSGAFLGSLAIRVSPSKTPVRSERREDSIENGNGN